MRNFLDTYVQTLTFRQRDKVSNIIRDALVGKDQLETIANNLASLSSFQGIVINNEAIADVVTSASYDLAFRNIGLNVAELFRVCNQISILLDSQTNILGQQISEIENEINALEKMIENYAFLLSDGRAFNFAYLETFSDEVNRDDFDFLITDRAGQVFLESQNATVDPKEGVLTLGKNTLTSSVPLVPSIVNSNVASFVQNKTYLGRMLTGDHPEGWKYTVRTTAPIRTSVIEAQDKAKGAQVVINFDVPNPTSASQIRFVPSSAHDIEIVRVVLFKSKEDTNGVELIPSPETINKPFTLNFPLQSVARFLVVLNQPTYERRYESDDNAERRYRELFEFVDNTQDDLVYTNQENGGPSFGRADIGHAWFLRMSDVLKNRPKGQSGSTMSFRSIPLYDKPRFEVDARRWRNEIQNSRNLQRDNLIETSIPSRIIGELLFKLYPELIKDKTYKDIKFRSLNVKQGTADREESPARVRIWNMYLRGLNAATIGRFYKYSLGLQYVGLGVGEAGYKGVHISKPLISEGDIGQVRLKTSESNIDLVNTNRHLAQVTSVEYSISTASSPKSETDWIPIQPIGQEKIIGERVFLDSSGFGSFRFPANRLNSVLLYKNGMAVPLDREGSLVYGENGDTIIGVRMASKLFSSTDIFTASYTPSTDYTTIDIFRSAQASTAPLVAAHDDFGSGEFFRRTGARNTITLANRPYIDYDQVASSIYSTTNGMTPYTPITVRLPDGTIAVNLTNYSTSLSNETSTLAPAFPSASEGVYFFHSGYDIIFNQEINESFTVYYKYLENNLRVRTVLRVNSNDFATPKVDYWHLKGKTRRPDKGSM